ncbi:Uncharacterized protein QJS10_CPA01g02029 [Acorus calamus]|uniref:Single-stranded DNA binding protein Ssb-like OB fold domain-containing protein n=1 Tax=Acorus calamus TaxID=4465 RepID=A0AAV9FIR9_ACOCL|nr:Uncharacterized protein QJS10_CPA01g02029 [Acorus calamus]
MPTTSLREALMKTPPVEGVMGVVRGLAAMRNGEALTPVKMEEKQKRMSSAQGVGGGSAASAEASEKPGLRKPVFTKVEQLKPGTNGHTLTVKKGRSASANLRQTRIAECLVGDETGTIVFTARNDQVDMMKAGATVILRNAKIDMFKGSMRLAVDKWGRVEVTEPATFVVKEDNNLSLVEYELVNVVEE